MKILQTLPILAAGLALMGCPADDAPPVDDTSSTGATTAPTTAPTTMTMTGADSGSTTTPTTDTDPDTGTTTTTGDVPDPGPTLPEFDPLDPMAYTAVDRVGFPAVNSGLNILGEKDVYNQATPVDDAALSFMTDIYESLYTLHRGIPTMETMNNTGLDDDLMALGLSPCNPPLAGGPSNCDDQTMPFVIPDVLKITVGGDPNFPNGRRPAEPVMDIIFAVLLLNGGDQLPTVLTFLDLDGDGTFGPSLNPLENDVPFSDDFPYLAPPHE